ncbi:hypothetical protein JAAARDRAFT_72802 [Jaapia argillacea MUCL 33604]|uniref:mRNA 3'-end-processing protein RNA14 n=1 Tax=Jaapia argillacea MUCL 33604 TaxID=933084 RepID=A0A067PP10_9AGAM|nr:hypothetical protein JAAARDRAFT_72802 [Jaapia argillacea MUCL 33604]
MSEPSASEPPAYEPPSSEQSIDTLGEKTEPTQEILLALQQLQESNTQPDIVVPKQEPEASPPRSELEVLRDKLRDKPYDPESWYRLVDLAESSGNIENLKITYDALLEAYPNTASAQIAYINHFLTPDSFQYAEGLFKKFLRASPSVDFWKFYLTYVRRINTDPSTRDDVQRSYEFALNHVGQDKDSGEIWSDYIQFLKSRECTTTWEEQQKMDALRKVYHRAVQIPLENIEKLWSELEAFENGLNKITAKKFMNDLSPSYMQARQVLRQLQRQLGPLFPPPPQPSSGRPALYLPAPPTFNPAERALVGQWKVYLKWEENNPLEIEDKDKATFVTRVQMVYRKALIRMRFFGEIWYMAYIWTKSVGKNEEALGLLKSGIESNPSSFLLNFAYAEALEAAKDHAGVHATFERFLDILRQDLESLESRINSANSSLEKVGSNQALNGNGNLAPYTDTSLRLTPPEPGTQSKDSSFSTQVSDGKPVKDKEFTERKTEYGLVWIMYIRFARRAEGLKASRPLFSKARKDRFTPWEVYEAAALMEYHCTKAMDVASRIFEAGMKAFGDEPEYVLRYLGFLISVNDENNARALFERIISTFSPDKARPLWERWARYVYQFGDLEAAQSLEKRIAESYPNDPPIKRFAQRHTYLGTDAIAARDLGFAIARQTATGTTTPTGPSALGRTDTTQSLLSIATQNSKEQIPPPAPPTSQKRPSSPDHKRRDESRASDHGPPAHKRPRSSPPRERERERWEGPSRRYASPSWDRERDRHAPPPRREREKEEEKPPVLPQILQWFIGQLPSPAAFNAYGEPAFRTDDLMQVFRNAIIPSATAAVRPRSPPPPPRAVGRPPPDYGPYQGPGGGRGGRRY